jgi:hypothetical protein
MPLLALMAAAASMHSFDVPKTLGDRVDEARATSNIAVRLPQTIRSEFSKLYGNTLPSVDGRYGLVLGAAPGCTGASVCGVANFYGIRGQKFSGGRKVSLAKGRKGRYHKSTCGANCSFPSIDWKQGGVLYTIEFKESTGRKNMVRLANSAIRKGPR